MKKRLTKWFGPDVPPTIQGVYQVKSDICAKAYSFWDGERWGYITHHDIQRAARERRGLYSGRTWRGLAEKPE